MSTKNTNNNMIKVITAIGGSKKNYTEDKETLRQMLTPFSW